MIFLMKVNCHGFDNFIIKNFAVFSGKENMCADEELLRLKVPALRLYGWKPACLSLGRNQKEIEADINFCQKNGIDIVRRPTGGKALFHDKELTYCFVCPSLGLSVSESYKNISDALVDAFNMLGIELEYGQKVLNRADKGYCMNLCTGADLGYNGKKLIGSAQFRNDEWILQHGSILLDADFELLEKIFPSGINKNSIITLKEINPEITSEELIEAVQNGFKHKFNI